jgi:hypothetical protein
MTRPDARMQALQIINAITAFSGGLIHDDP